MSKAEAFRKKAFGTLGGHALNAASRLWRKYGKSKLVLQMEAAAAAFMKTFYEDFYWLNLLRFEQGVDDPFCWIVREHGTDLIPLEGDETNMGQVSSWLQALSAQYSEEEKLHPGCRLYVVDLRTGTLTRKRSFSEISVSVLATSGA